jgi:hypothetical protein
LRWETGLSDAGAEQSIAVIDHRSGYLSVLGGLDFLHQLLSRRDTVY